MDSTVVNTATGISNAIVLITQGVIALIGVIGSFVAARRKK